MGGRSTRDMPSSFKGIHGRIVYMVEVKVSMGWLRCSQLQTEFNFVSNSFSHLGHGMRPQSGSVGKEIGVFSKGQVQLSATVNTKVCSPGDTLSVDAKICNSSSKKVKPKFRLQQKTVYRASGSTNSSDQTLCKIVGETIALNSEETVSCQLKIPADAIPTLHHCEIISVHHYLKVYLDISFAFNPEVVFPLVIVPSSFARPYPGEAVGPYSAGAPSYSDFPPPAFLVGPYPVPAGPGAYGYPAPDPTQNRTISGYNNQWPQQASACGFSTAASSLMQQQAPTAPPLVQQGEDPPSYMSLFNPSQDTLSRTGSEHKS
ncbi:arrestin domain-containing protein 2-like [Perca flavescens]|uniref:arrestin domain-containing protein 2-like n=1 Tax=Perca flavescens TaxID=8167 RepID=UPI00106F02F9|nr:arrestin domain-containing protein 2-like [Perca flavescens]